MKRKILSIFLCSVMLLGNVSCNKKKETNNNSKSVESTTTSNAANESTTAVITTPQPLLPPMTEPIEYFEGFETNGIIRGIFEGTDNTILIQCDTYDKSTCYVFDPINDEIIKTVQLDDLNNQVIGMFSNGTIVAVDNNSGKKVYMYSENSDKPNEISLDIDFYPDFKLDDENNCIYWFEALSENIIKMTETGNISTQVYGKDFKLIYSFLSDDLSFYAAQPSEETKSGIETGIYSIRDSKLIAPITENYYQSFFTKDNCITSYYNYFDDNVNGNLILQVADYNNTSKEAYKIRFGEYDTYETKSNSESDYSIIIRNNFYPDNESTELMFFDAKNGTLADSGIDFGNEIAYFSCIYSENIGRWIIALNPDGEPSSLLMIEPALLNYDRQLDSTVPYQIEKQDIIEVGDNFKEIRKEADKIEEDFGIELLIGDEVKISESNSQYIFTSTEKYDDEYYIQREMENMRELRKILEMYPEDFFNHFKGKNGKCGLRISIVDELDSKENEFFVAAGLAYTNGGWYDIAICSHTIYETDTSLHHELWHSVENLINDRHGYIDETEWTEFNPDGFEYTQDLDDFATNNTYDFNAPTLDNINSQKEPSYDFPYFISDYSMITPMEDRATLIEHLLSLEFKDHSNYMQLIDINEIKKYHHLNAKIKYLEEWSKQEFGYVYWEKIHEKSRDVHYYN